jgi:hypothetical protein
MKVFQKLIQSDLTNNKEQPPDSTLLTQETLLLANKIYIVALQLNLILVDQ